MMIDYWVLEPLGLLFWDICAFPFLFNIEA